MYLTVDEVRALHIIEGDGQWWMSFSPEAISQRKDQ